MKQKIGIMVGLPGSGKSYKAKQLIDDGVYDISISSDALRKELFGDEDDQTHNAEVFSEYYKRFRDAICCSKNVILDSTNCTYKIRRRIFAEINASRVDRSDLYITAYIINTKLDTVIERDASRDRTVGEDVIKKFYMSYQHPQYFEGFNDIQYDVFHKFNALDCARIVSFMREFNQDNPHHNLTLGDHCYEVASNYNVNTLMWWTALFHDIGKINTKVFDDDCIAHYYGHECAGAYDLASHTEYTMLSPDELTRALLFINNHMRAHDIKEEKTKEKYRKLYGSDVFDKLMEFAENDRKRGNINE